MAAERTQIEDLTAQIEEMWGHLEVLFDRVDTNNRWGQKHGADWTFADVPYHLAYCNQDLVAYGLTQGPDYPEAEQELLNTMQALSEWNDRKFAERPEGQTVAVSVAQWRESCSNIREIMTGMTDADLEKPCWMPLFLGWATARELLSFCRTHDWSEFTQLRIHMGLTEPVPSAAITRAYLDMILNFFPMVLNQDAAQGREFAAVMAFTDPEVGAWTIRVTEGKASLSYGADSNPDLVITQSAETFEKTFRGIQNPAEAMQAGDVQANNMESLVTFGQLFPS